MCRRLRILAAVALIPLLSLVAVGPASAAHQGPPVRVPGLHAAAWITRDVEGIAHIRAGDQRDLFFLQGWVHAADRLFQMDVTRRQASGTLAELLGQPALAGDVQARTIGLRRAAERGLPVQSPEGRQALDAYAAGVNAWVASHRLPAQYAAIQITKFQPWTPVDSLVIGKAISFNLSFDLDLDLTTTALAYQAAGAAAGFNGAALFSEDLYRSQPFSNASTVPDATGTPARATGVTGAPPASGTVAARSDVPPAAARLAEAYRAQAGRTPFLANAVHRTFAMGSNEWAIAGRYTATGKPILANDPHLALTSPSTFYPVALKSGNVDVQGEGFAGAPYVILGQTRDIAWGATTNPMDVTDTYVEQVLPDSTSPSGLSTVYQGRLEHVVAIPETFRVNQRTPGGVDRVVPVPPGNGVPATTLIVPRRNNGPIVAFDSGSGTALSVQYTGFSPTRELDTFRLFDSARTLHDFQQALRYFDVGSQNWAYTDTRGHIAYFTSAEMPLREDLQAGTVNGAPPYLLRNGTGGNEWLPATHHYPGQALPYEILPPQEMPHVIDPANGFFVNANNDPIGTTLDNNPLNEVRPGGGIYYLNPGYDGFRAGRITEMVRTAIRSGRRLTTRDVRDQQADVTLLDAEFFTPYLVAALTRARASSTPALAELGGDPRVVQAVGRLAAWDRSTPTGIPQGYDASDANGQLAPPSATEVTSSVAATIYSVWRGQYLRNIIDAHIAPYGLTQSDSQTALTGLKTLLLNFDTRHGVGASGIDFYAVTGVSDPADRRDILLLRSVSDALTLLSGPAFEPAFHRSTNQNDYRWGDLHRVVFSSVLGAPWSIPPGGGSFPNPLGPALPGLPTDGGFSTVDAASHNARAASVNAFMFGGGPVRRFVAQARPGGIRATSALPGGTSEHLDSPYYANLLPRWLTDDPYPVRLYQQDLPHATASITRYLPG